MCRWSLRFKCEGVVCDASIGEVCDAATGFCVGGSGCSSDGDCDDGFVCDDGVNAVVVGMPIAQSSLVPKVLTARTLLSDSFA